jgi:hypothetical protein
MNSECQAATNTNSNQHALAKLVKENNYTRQELLIEKLETQKPNHRLLLSQHQLLEDSTHKHRCAHTGQPWYVQITTPQNKHTKNIELGGTMGCI